MLDNPQIYVAALVALVFLVIYLTVDRMTLRSQRLKKLARNAGLTNAYNDAGFTQQLSAAVELEQEPTLGARVMEQFMRVIGINVDANMQELRPQIARAGMEITNPPIYVLFYKRIIAPIIVLCGVLVLVKGGGKDIYFVGAFLLVIGFFGAHLYITNATQKRKKTLLRSFPDGLDLMVVCVESGLALDAAINRVCGELSYAHPQLAKELNRTRMELALLNNRSQALSNLAERTDLVAFRSLAAALIQTERFGTNLTDTLRVLSDDYRQTRLMLAEEKAGRLPALMAVPLIILLLPALILIILGPPFVVARSKGGLFGNS